MLEYPEVGNCISEAIFIVCECHIHCVVAVRSGHIQLCNSFRNCDIFNEYSIDIDGYVADGICRNPYCDCAVPSDFGVVCSYIDLIAAYLVHCESFCECYSSCSVVSITIIFGSDVIFA